MFRYYSGRVVAEAFMHESVGILSGRENNHHIDSMALAGHAIEYICTNYPLWPGDKEGNDYEILL